MKRVTHLYLIFCDHMDCSPPGSSVYGILQSRILEWTAIPFSRVSSWSRDCTQVSCNTGRFFTIWATREAHKIEYYTILKWSTCVCLCVYVCVNMDESEEQCSVRKKRLLKALLWSWCSNPGIGKLWQTSLNPAYYLLIRSTQGKTGFYIFK